jgi:KaiC/GvpD/RAD55 family RecA-like ATPase
MGNILVIGDPGSGKTRLIFKYISDYDKIVWVTTIKSAERVRKELGQFNFRELWVVDTHTWQRRATHTKYDVVVSNPLNLNEVSLSVGKVLDNVKRDYFLAFDSISGLLLYHHAPKVIQFLRNLVVRLESEGGRGIFTLVKNAHDVHTETSVSLIFNNILQLERIFDGESVKRLVKVIRASRYIEPEISEFKIASNGIELNPSLDAFIKEELKR